MRDSESVVPSGKRALVVDDDPVSLQITTRVLHRLDVDNRAVSQSYGLLNHIVSYRPSLVLLDVNMPGLDGPTLVTLIRADREIATTTILLHSALEAEQLARKARECGADGYVPKSLGLIYLEKSLIRWIARLEPHSG